MLELWTHFRRLADVQNRSYLEVEFWDSFKRQANVQNRSYLDVEFWDSFRRQANVQNRSYLEVEFWTYFRCQADVRNKPYLEVSNLSQEEGSCCLIYHCFRVVAQGEAECRKTLKLWYMRPHYLSKRYIALLQLL